jgi:hypothetical protein
MSSHIPLPSDISKTIYPCNTGKIPWSAFFLGFQSQRSFAILWSDFLVIIRPKVQEILSIKLFDHWKFDKNSKFKINYLGNKFTLEPMAHATLGVMERERERENFNTKKHLLN